MKRKILWILPILLAAAAITILVIALRRDGEDPNKIAPATQTEAPVEETAAPVAANPALPEEEAPEPTDEPVELVSAEGRAVAETPEPAQSGNWNTPSGGTNPTPPPPVDQGEDELPLMP